MRIHWRTTQSEHRKCLKAPHRMDSPLFPSASSQETHPQSGSLMKKQIGHMDGTGAMPRPQKLAAPVALRALFAKKGSQAPKVKVDPSSGARLPTANIKPKSSKVGSVHLSHLQNLLAVRCDPVPPIFPFRCRHRHQLRGAMRSRASLGGCRQSGVRMSVPRSICRASSSAFDLHSVGAGTSAPESQALAV